LNYDECDNLYSIIDKTINENKNDIKSSNRSNNVVNDKNMINNDNPPFSNSNNENKKRIKKTR